MPCWEKHSVKLFFRELTDGKKAGHDWGSRSFFNHLTSVDSSAQHSSTQHPRRELSFHQIVTSRMVDDSDLGLLENLCSKSWITHTEKNKHTIMMKSKDRVISFMVGINNYMASICSSNMIMTVKWYWQPSKKKNVIIICKTFALCFFPNQLQICRAYKYFSRMIWRCFFI